MIAFFIMANLVFFGVVVDDFDSPFFFFGGFTVAMKLNFPSSLRLDLWCKETCLSMCSPSGRSLLWFREILHFFPNLCKPTDDSSKGLIILRICDKSLQEVFFSAA